MNRKFLEQIWRMGKRGDEFTLPYLDDAQEIIGFINEMDLTSVGNMTKPLTEEGAAWLLSRYPKDLIMDVMCSMENYKGLNRKYKSAKLTIHNWCKKRQRDAGVSSGTGRNIPVT